MVQKSLNVQVVQDALIKAGLSQSKLAEKLNVSREAVSKWIARESFPQPDKLLRLGMLLGLSIEQIMTRTDSPAVPVVYFRKKANRKTTDGHLDEARQTGELLKRLVGYLPRQPLTQPPVLKKPRCDYDYIQSVAFAVRSEMKLDEKPVIDFGDLIGKFNELQAVIVPVLWGDQQHHGNALNIFLPDSKTTWVFLNLDSRVVDFKFWMAHELGHSLAPDLHGDEGEDFADSFAQALLFPEKHVVSLHRELSELTRLSLRVARIQAEARKHIISPYTIRLAIEAYEVARRVEKVDLGAPGNFMAASSSFIKGGRKISEVLFKNQPPMPADYSAVARTAFGSAFFESLSAYCKVQDGAEHYVQRVLGLSLIDAKTLTGELSR